MLQVQLLALLRDAGRVSNKIPSLSPFCGASGSDGVGTSKGERVALLIAAILSFSPLIIVGNCRDRPGSNVSNVVIELNSKSFELLVIATRPVVIKTSA